MVYCIHKCINDYAFTCNTELFNKKMERLEDLFEIDITDRIEANIHGINRQTEGAAISVYICSIFSSI